MNERHPRERDAAHLSAIRKLPCLGCGTDGKSEAAHLRAACAEHGKRETGIGEKPDDRWTLPLCYVCHRTGPGAQHAQGELAFWEEKGIDPFEVAQALSEASPDLEIMRAIVVRARCRLPVMRTET